MVWFDPLDATSVFDHWGENLIVDEGPPETVVVDVGAATADVQTGGAAANVTEPTAEPTAQEVETVGTLVNALLIVDIDGDGFNDIVGTVDRVEYSGLTNDALIWFRNDRE